MGWAKGSFVFDAIWEKIRVRIPEEDREEACAEIMSAFDLLDWDTQNECIRAEWPEVGFYIYQTDPEYFDELVENWEEYGDDNTPVWEFLEITEDHFNRLTT